MVDFIGRFHPLLVHLPIGILLIAVLFQLLSWRKSYLLFDRALSVSLLVGGIAAVFSCITGYLLSQTAEYDAATVGWHQWLGIATAVVSLGWYWLQVKRSSSGALTIIALTVLVLLMITGHLGGTLTHGEDYLSLNGGDDKEETASRSLRVPLKDAQQAMVYKDVVEPVLATSCYSCHGDKKQKGKLRLDLPELILKGGKNGSVLEGSAEDAELIKRLLLPLDDKKHMPPKEKPQLTAGEIALLHWWVENGSSFDKKVLELPQPDKVKTVLKSLEKANTDTVAAVPLPAEAVDPAPVMALDALKKRGVVILPVAGNTNYLTANFVSVEGVTDTDVQLLKPVSKQLVSLKIGSTKITDAALKTIGELTRLVRLQLEHTLITDNGLKSLVSLERLQDLNLVGTGVTAQGVMQLKPMTSIRKIYLYQSKVEQTQWGILKQAFPAAKIDSGGYQVPVLVGDTTRL